jgi:hypothetical protein
MNDTLSELTIHPFIRPGVTTRLVVSWNTWMNEDRVER